MAQKTTEQRFKQLSTWLAIVSFFTLASLIYLTTEFFSKESPKTDIPPKIYKNMKLTRDNLKTVFTPVDASRDPNDIKQLYYGWFENKPNEFGLVAFGVDAKGNQLSERVKLTIPDEREYETCWSYDTEPIMVNPRGQLKNLLGSEGIDRDVVIEESKYSDIIFMPQMKAYAGTTSTMYFDIKASSTGKAGTANPAPPFSYTCTTCDGR